MNGWLRSQTAVGAAGRGEGGEEVVGEVIVASPTPPTACRLKGEAEDDLARGCDGDPISGDIVDDRRRMIDAQAAFLSSRKGSMAWRALIRVTMEVARVEARFTAMLNGTAAGRMAAVSTGAVSGSNLSWLLGVLLLADLHTVAEKHLVTQLKAIMAEVLISHGSKLPADSRDLLERLVRAPS